MQNLIIQNIKERRSIRDYQEKPIDKDILKEIIQAGKYAPSAKNDQPWKFIVITNKEYIQKLSQQIKNEIKKLMKFRFIYKLKIKELKNMEILKFLFAVVFSEKDLIFFNAPALILILTEKKLFYDESCACSAQNMMLAANSMGIGSCWIGFASVLGLNKKIIKNIGIPDKHHISAAIIFGYPNNKSNMKAMRKIGSDIIKWIE